jgi:hypothetical protein
MAMPNTMPGLLEGKAMGVVPPKDMNRPSNAQPSGQPTIQQAPTPVTSQTTTTNQNWGDGKLEVTPEGAFFTPPADPAPPATQPSALEGPTLSPDDSRSPLVEDRLTGLLSGESKYVEAARTQAQNFANQRGLLNTTMAATAGEKAAIGAALPIASQDAGYFQQKDLYQTQGDISSRLSAQGFEQQKVLNDAQISFQELELDARVAADKAKLGEADRQRFDNAVNTIQSEYNRDYMEVLANPDWETPEARDEAVEILKFNASERMRIAASISGYEFDWDPGTGSTSSTESSQSTENTNPLLKDAANAIKNKPSAQDAVKNVLNYETSGTP